MLQNWQHHKKYIACFFPSLYSGWW